MAAVPKDIESNTSALPGNIWDDNEKKASPRVAGVGEEVIYIRRGRHVSKKF